MPGIRTAYRLEIEGLPLQAVTDPELERELADGRRRVCGLVRDGMQISEQVDLAHADLQAEGMQISIVDRPDNTWTQALTQRPQRRSYLTVDMSPTEAGLLTITDAFQEGDVVHVGTEAMKIVNVLGAGYYAVSRGYWGTTACAYVAPNASELSRYEVTDRPLCIEGRRAKIYRYVEGIDDFQGDGTQIWIGVCTTDARLSGGTTFQIYIDSIWSLFDTELGSDLEAGVKPRGIYYPFASPLKIAIQSVPGWTFQPGDLGLEITYHPPDFEADWVIRLAGFWESTADLVAELVPIFEALQASDPHPALEYRTSTSPPTMITAVLCSDGTWGVRATNHLFISGSRTEFDPADPSSYWAPSGVVVAVETYSPTLTAGTVSFPRTALTRGVVGDIYAILPPVIAAAYHEPPVKRIPIETAISALESEITFTIEGGDKKLMCSGTYYPTLDGIPRVIKVGDVTDEDGNTANIGVWGPETTIRATRQIARGHFANFVQSLKDQAPTLAGVGGSPLITSQDIVTPADVVTLAAQGRAPLLDREYAAFEALDLQELIAEECKLLGIFPHLDHDGRVTFSRLALPSAVALSDFVIGDSDRIVDNGFPSWERNSSGSINVARVKTGYDVVEDKWNGPEFTVRDVIALSNRRATKRLRIQPKSRSKATWTAEIAATIGAEAIGIYGRPYVTTTLEVPYTLADVARVGSICDAYIPHAPDVQTGGRGYYARGLVTGRMWALDQEERLQLTLLLSDDAAGIAGYAPSAYALAYDGGDEISGVSLSIEGVDLADPGESLKDLFPAGSRVWMGVWDTSDLTPAVTGVVYDVSDDAMRVAWDGAKPPPTGPYRIGFAPWTTDLDESQRLFAFWGPVLDASGDPELSLKWQA